MDPALLQYYERELQFIREMGVEYAKEFPKIASKLNIDGLQVPDPYVERLFEGFAFLSARLNLRMDAEYPRFTQNLLNIVYPHYLTPCPAMAIVQLQAIAKASLDGGYKLERGAALRGKLAEGEQTSCEFRTVQNCTLWPVEIAETEYFTNLGRLEGLALPTTKTPRAGLRLRLQNVNQDPLNILLLDRLRLYLGGHGTLAMRLYEQILGNCCAVVYANGNKQQAIVHRGNSLEPVGFADEDALLPDLTRSFSGYRLLREYFAFAERFMFFDICQLGRAIEQCTQPYMDILLIFDRYDAELENRVTPNDFLLNCVPIINLFHKRVDRIHLSKAASHHIVADRTRPHDFEIFDVTKVVGHGSNSDDRQVFYPFYRSQENAEAIDQLAYYTLQRERRVLSMKEKQMGPRSNYIGSECYLSLVDGHEAPYSRNLKQLEVHALCTNRDLPLRIPRGIDSEFNLEISAPVAAIKCVKGPTRPRPSLGYLEGEVGWRLINHLSINYLALVDRNDGSGAAALRELLLLYCDNQDAAHRKQIEGIRNIRTETITQRVPGDGPIAFARGQSVHVTMDESAFAGTGIFLLGAVLEVFFSRYVSINSFSQTTLYGLDRGEVCQWPARLGGRNSL